MAKRINNPNQFDLFAEPEEAPPRKEWQEVPFALFISWSLKMQYKYCADRDKDAAEICDDQEMKEWYLWRAEKYVSLSSVE